MATTGQCKICIGIFSLDILYLEGKSPLLMRNNQVNFGDILPETSKSSGFWDMGVNSHLKWLLLFSPYEAGEWGWHPSTLRGAEKRKRVGSKMAVIIGLETEYGNLSEASIANYLLLM